jgi:hypothetical protein
MDSFLFFKKVFHKPLRTCLHTCLYTPAITDSHKPGLQYSLCIVAHIITSTMTIQLVEKPTAMENENAATVEELGRAVGRCNEKLTAMRNENAATIEGLGRAIERCNEELTAIGDNHAATIKELVKAVEKCNGKLTAIENEHAATIEALMRAIGKYNEKLDMLIGDNKRHATSAAQLVTDRLDTPSGDDRSYRNIMLPNELEALIIHDANTDNASAAMNVGVGSFNDKKGMQGVAHAVE